MMFESDLEKINGLKFSLPLNQANINSSSEDYVLNRGGVDFDEEYSTQKSKNTNGSIYM